MTRPVRYAIAACWFVVAFLILRMLWGGSLFGIVYVLHHSHPIILLADAGTVVAAVAVAVVMMTRASQLALGISTALSCFTIGFSFVLATEDHGSVPAIAVAAVIALVLALRPNGLGRRVLHLRGPGA